MIAKVRTLVCRLVMTSSIKFNSGKQMPEMISRGWRDFAIRASSVYLSTASAQTKIFTVDLID